MKKIAITYLIIGMSALMLSACSSKEITPERVEKVESAWSIGKLLGGLFLSDDAKDKAKPYVDGTEKAYGEVKDSLKKDAE